MSRTLVNVSLVLLGFVVGLMIPVHKVKAQEEHQYASLQMKDVVEILANYDVRHVPDLPGIPFYGVTDHDKHIIMIVDNQDFIFKKRTVIHELGHVVARMRNQVWDEETTNIFEAAEYNKLFVEPQP